MSTDPQLATTVLMLPAGVEAAILSIEDAAATLGEMRCLTGHVVLYLNSKRRSNDFTRGDALVEALLAVVSRLADDHPSAVTGAITPADCRCRLGTSVLDAVVDRLKVTPLLKDERPGTGAYL